MADNSRETGTKPKIPGGSKRSPAKQKSVYTLHAYGEAAPSREAPPSDAPSRDAPSSDAPSRDAPPSDAPSRDAPPSGSQTQGAIKKKSVGKVDDKKENPPVQQKKRSSTAAVSSSESPYPPLEDNPVFAVVTPHGTMSMVLRDNMRVDITVDRGVRVLNFETDTIVAMSSSGTSVGMIHKKGRIFQYDNRVDVMADVPNGNKKFAKMTSRGVDFTSANCHLVYLTDSVGTRIHTRTSADLFADLKYDFTVRVFYEGSRHGERYISDCAELMRNAHTWRTEDGAQHWSVNGVRVVQAWDGMVRIAKINNKLRMRSSPTNGSAFIATPAIHCTASLGEKAHLFARSGERRMHYDGASFVIRNAGHSAGFDENDQFKVY